MLAYPGLPALIGLADIQCADIYQEAGRSARMHSLGGERRRLQAEVVSITYCDMCFGTESLSGTSCSSGVVPVGDSICEIRMAGGTCPAGDS